MKKKCKEKSERVKGQIVKGELVYFSLADPAVVYPVTFSNQPGHWPANPSCSPCVLS